ncbi:hypothetical protein C8J57DRAFT_1668462 [Mycena rebaudengoi]|nr:hypothetical protein C8J57DRAFT_1668462 [Mycena rebaudengoi]
MYQIRQYDTPQIPHTGIRSDTPGKFDTLPHTNIGQAATYLSCLFPSPTIHRAAAPAENVPFLLPQCRRTGGALYRPPLNVTTENSQNMVSMWRLGRGRSRRITKVCVYTSYECNSLLTPAAPAPFLISRAHAVKELLLVPRPPERECLCSRCPSSCVASQAMPGCGRGRSVGDAEWLALRGGKLRTGQNTLLATINIDLRELQPEPPAPAASLTRPMIATQFPQRVHSLSQTPRALRWRRCGAPSLRLRARCTGNPVRCVSPSGTRSAPSTPYVSSVDTLATRGCVSVSPRHCTVRAARVSSRGPAALAMPRGYAVGGVPDQPTSELSEYDNYVVDSSTLRPLFVFHNLIFVAL